VDSTTLVNFRFDAGRKLLAQLVRNSYQVEAAFWLETTEDNLWLLYLVTPLVEQIGLAEAIGRLHPLLYGLPGTPLSLSEIRLIESGNPIAKDVLSLLERPQDDSGINYRGSRLGDLSIEWAYIYPESFYHEQPDTTTISEDLFRQLLELLSRGPGPHPKSKVALRDGSSFVGVPTSVSLEDDQPVVKFVVDSPLAPRVVSTLDIVSIQ